MLNKLAAIENFINRVLLKLISVVARLLTFFIPKKFINFSSKLSQSFNRKVSTTNKKLSTSKQNIKDYILNIKLKIFLNIDKFIKYSHQKEFNKITSELKAKILSTPPDQYFKKIKSLIKALFLLVKKSFSKLLTSQAAVRALSISLIVTGATSIYLSYNDIYQAENPNRSPASVQEYDYRPEYKTFQSRSLKVMNMKVPVEVESVREISSITIDFSIRTTTRFSKLFLENYEYKLKDYFFTTVQPVISNFPLEAEGKDVLKEKITEEVNNFLRENGVEGKVEEIEIVFIVAS